jgi:hypothetical protein
MMKYPYSWDNTGLFLDLRSSINLALPPTLTSGSSFDSQEKTVFEYLILSLVECTSGTTG